MTRPLADPTSEPSAGQQWPGVSVVMPVLDEERHLETAVRRVLAQEYVGPLEVVLAVAPSKDGTAAVAARLTAEDPRVRTVDNASGRTASGLNAAIAATTHPVVVRVDGHSVLPRGYIRRAVEVLQQTAADNVGGIMDPRGVTPFEQAVARAMSSRLGIGGARFHVGGEPGPAETVYLGVFRRQVLERLGGFDERFTRAQDWELNHRIRAAGGTVWFSPDLRVSYRPRSSPRALARQFYRTGQWRREVLRRYPDTASPRYLAAPLTVVLVTVGSALGLVAAAGGPRWAVVGLVAPLGYGALFAGGSVVAGQGLPARARAWLPLVLSTMHLSWGLGFLRGAGGG